MSDEALPRMDPERERPENHWIVNTTAMTQDEAERAAALIEAQFAEVFATVVDPRRFLTLHLDRWTTELVRDALRSVVAAGGNVGSLLADVDEFLAYAHPYDEDETPWPGLR